MKIETDAKLVTIYVNCTDQWHGQPLHVAIVNLCKDRGIAGATAIRCVEGYGGSGHIHTARLLELSENLPLRIEIIDIAERIEPLLPVLEPMISEGLLTIANVHIRRYLREPKK
jgi:PII-like signaling protein